MAKVININKSVTIRFNWKGKSHQRTLLAKNFADQIDRFYAYFYIGKDYFHFEDDMECGQAQLRMPGAWFVPEAEDQDMEYYWKPEDLQVLKVDGQPVSLINNGRG